MNYQVKYGLRKIGIGLVFGLLSYLMLANCETSNIYTSGFFVLAGGVLFIVSARQIVLALTHFNNW